MRRMAWIAGTTLIALCAQIESASAAERGFYIGASGGRSEYKVDINDLAPGLASATSRGVIPSAGIVPFAGFIPAGTPVIVIAQPATSPPIFTSLNPFAPFTQFTTTSLDRTDATWSLTAGYRINRYLSVELAYLDLGQIELRNAFTFTGPFSFELRTEQRIEMSSVAASVLGSWPVSERWSLHARGGYELTDSESRLSVNDATVVNADDSSGNLVIGFGVDFAWTPQWTVRAEAERHLDIGGDVFVNESDADAFRLMVMYRL